MPFVDTLCCASGQGLTIGTDQHCTAWCFHVSVMEVMRDAFHARLMSGLKSVGSIAKDRKQEFLNEHVCTIAT